MDITAFLSRQAKALAAVLVVTGTTLLVFITGNETLADVTTQEWLIVVIETLGVYGVVYAVPNADPK